jgi:hypothetical protein
LGLENWQDHLVDDENKSKIIFDEINGKRYKNILQNIFPVPL